MSDTTSDGPQPTSARLVTREGPRLTLLRRLARGQLTALTHDEITVLRWLGYVESDLSLTHLGRSRLAQSQREHGHSLHAEARA